MRRLFLLVGAIVLADMVFYAAITPLLPVYVDRFELSKTGAGVLAGAYAAGTLLGSLPSAWLTLHVGSRRTVVIGLLLMSLASIGFAFGSTVAELDAMRFLQGLGGACTWAGGLGWLISRTPADERGRMIGSAMSAVLVGLLLGPALGAIARGIGPEVPFCTVAVLGFGLVAAALRMEAPPLAIERERPLATVMGDWRVSVGMALVAVPALVFGAIEVLTPLQLDQLGAGGGGIAATFLAAAAIEAVAQQGIGHATDRVGRGRPLRFGLAGSVVFLLLLPLPQTAWVLGIVIAVGCAICGIVNTPAMALISDGVAALGIDQGFGFALVNLTWAAGQVGGTIAGAALAGATSDTIVYVALAGVCATALGLLVRAGRQLPVTSGAA